MNRIRFSILHPFWPAIVLLAGLLLALSITSAKALPVSPATPTNVPGGIRGTLYEPGGTTPVAYGWIDIHDAEGQPWMGTDTALDGSFSIANLPPGLYFLRAYPPEGSPLAASVPMEVLVVSGKWTDADLLLTEVGISGYVRDCDAVPEQRIEGAWVVAEREEFRIWDSTNISGEFKLGGVTPGLTYTLHAFPPPESPYRALPASEVIPIATGVVLELCIPPLSVEGVVEDPVGNPVPEAWIVVWNDFHWEETTADISGTFSFRGLPPGEFWLHAGPPWGSQGLISADPFTITVSLPPAVTNVGVTLPYAVKTVTGQVVIKGTPIGIPDAEVRARRLDGSGFAGSVTDPNGEFSLSLTGGEWHLNVAPPEPPAPPAEWIFPGPPAWVVFEPNLTPEADTVKLEVIPTNAWVAGQVLCPGGVPCRDEPAHGDIWIELRNDEIRNGTELNPEFGFEIPIPDGWYELVVHVNHPLIQGPEPIPVFVGPNQRLTLIEPVILLLRDGLITGKVRNEMGVGIPSVLVVGWQPEGFGWGWAETDATGTYTMPVIGGEWFVEPQPGPKLPFVFRQRPKLVRVAPGGQVNDVNFKLDRAESRIKGAAVDADTGERLWGLDGWAWAEHHVAANTFEFFSDAPMWDSSFELKVRGNEFYVVGVGVPPQAPYVSGSAGPLYVPPLARESITVPLEHKNAVIEGSLVVAGTNPPQPAHGVWAEVFGEDEQGHWVTTRVDPDSAWYELGVISSTWHLRAWVDPASGYVAVPTATVATVSSGQVLSFLNFEVWPIEAAVSGRVLQPNGDPLSRTIVFAKGESPHVGYFETFGRSDELGNYEFVVPEGRYVVGAGLPGHKLEMLGWLNPPPVDVPVSVANPAVGVDLHFRQLDGAIHGTISFAPGIVATATHPAYVWGYTDSGEWAETEAITSGANAFTYTLRVISDTVWHVGAVYEDWDNGVFYESPEATVPVPPTPPIANAYQDLELGGPWPLPQPIIVSFDGTQMQTIQLLVPPDRFLELVIPARALVDQGTVTLFIFPTRELRPEAGREIVGAGYEMWAVDENGQEITEFNKHVIMTFPYPSDTDLAQHGISEYLLVPVYYSTLVGHWILADSYVVDTKNNEITLQIDHFTKFGTLSTQPGETTVYLPIVVSQHP